MAKKKRKNNPSSNTGWMLLLGAGAIYLLTRGSKGNTPQGDVPLADSSSDTSGGTAPPYAPAPVPRQDRSYMVARARSALSDRSDSWFVMGAKPAPSDVPPFNADCSGFVNWVYGGTLAVGTTALRAAGYKQVSRDVAMTTPGILVFGPPGHVAISTGEGTVVEAYNSDYGILENKMRSDFYLFLDPMG